MSPFELSLFLGILWGVAIGVAAESIWLGLAGFFVGFMAMALGLIFTVGRGKT
jgi:hypothetical protein